MNQFSDDLLLPRAWRDCLCIWVSWPDRTGHQNLQDRSSRLDWIIRTYFFKHFTYQVQVINSHKMRSLDKNLVSKVLNSFLKEIWVLKSYIKRCLWMPLSHDKRSKGRKSFPISVVMRSWKPFELKQRRLSMAQ